MKASLILVFALLLARPLLGQETMENADFSDGSNHWHGDCKPAGSELSNDLLTSSAGSAVGIVIDLRSHNWTKVTQEIHGYKGDWQHGTVLTIVYQTSSDFKLSNDPSDHHSNIGPNVGFGGANVFGHPGELVAFVDVPPSSRASASTSGLVTTYTIYSDDVSSIGIKPGTDSSLQTFTSPLQLPRPIKEANPTFCLAIPPGTGSITITKISISTKSASADSSPEP